MRKTEQPCDRAVVEGEPLVGARGVAAEHDGGSALERAEICEPYRQQIIELLPRCKSNLFACRRNWRRLERRCRTRR